MICLRRLPFKKAGLGLVVLVLVLAACGSDAGHLPVVEPVMTDAENPSSVTAVYNAVENYLNLWQAQSYPAMYDQLSAFSQDAISQTDFESQHQQIAETIMLTHLDFQILSVFSEDGHAQAAYRIDFDTVLLDVFSTETIMNLVYESGAWRIQWEIGMVLPALRGGNTLQLVYQVPSRGRIYDQNGSPLAAYESAVALGLVPGEILPAESELLYETLAELSYYDPDDLARMVESTPDDWYLPVVSLSQADVMPYMDILTSLNGVRIDEFRARYYLDGGIAPHVLGYLLKISEEDLPAYQALGYRKDESVGAAGLEAAFESELAGKRGGILYVLSPAGEVIGLLASRQPESAQSLYTTIDAGLQLRLQESLVGMPGAVAVMAVDSGRVLALVSSPHFDPNAFDLTHIDRSLLESYFTDPDQPLFNRVTQGQYPLGSVFKIVSMAAAMESGLYNAGSTFICGHSLWVCDSVTLYDWTFGHGAAASGELTLSQGLMRSCNPWFYRIGESLFVEGMDGTLSEMAGQFGLGMKTGIEINEVAGNIPPTAETCVNSAQMAIGQGEILVTPIQVVRFIAALANGGQLYRPVLVDAVQPVGEQPPSHSAPEVVGNLDLSAATLDAILGAMQDVVESPRGTAYWALESLAIPVSGKTGTAQTPTGDAHAWFAGFTRVNDPARPDIAVVVLIENGGEGSVMAAPVFRRVVSLWFSDNQDPGGVLPWESEPYVPDAPENSPTPTPMPTSEE